MSENRELTANELRWCRRLERVLKAKPRKLDIYVGMDTVDIFTEGVMEANFDEYGDVDNLHDDTSFTIFTEIRGDGSGL